MRAVVFYDNLATVSEEDPSMVEVERIYCVDVDAFVQVDWSRLDDIYRSLPGDHRKTPLPMWFGDDEERLPFLWASAEPAGIQVYGILPPTEWAEWDRAFVTALNASELPRRHLRHAVR
jgi:hypothetical protein